MQILQKKMDLFFFWTSLHDSKIASPRDAISLPCVNGGSQTINQLSDSGQCTVMLRHIRIHACIYGIL